jgi:hypothetical protein
MKHTRILVDKMKIKCIKISISDEELGCHVTFSNKRSLVEEVSQMTVQDNNNLNNKYNV